jgi:hypothetical protein
VNASLLAIRQGRLTSVLAFADPLGNRTVIGDSFFPVPPNPFQTVGKYSDLGVGWRVSPDFFFQYVYSTDYGYAAASHTVMLRYRIRLRREK